MMRRSRFIINIVWIEVKKYWTTKYERQKTFVTMKHFGNLLGLISVFLLIAVVENNAIVQDEELQL